MTSATASAVKVVEARSVLSLYSRYVDSFLRGYGIAKHKIIEGFLVPLHFGDIPSLISPSMLPPATAESLVPCLMPLPPVNPPFVPCNSTGDPTGDRTSTNFGLARCLWGLFRILTSHPLVHLIPCRTHPRTQSLLQYNNRPTLSPTHIRTLSANSMATAGHHEADYNMSYPEPSQFSSASMDLGPYSRSSHEFRTTMSYEHRASHNGNHERSSTGVYPDTSERGPALDLSIGSVSSSNADSPNSSYGQMAPIPGITPGVVDTNNFHLPGSEYFYATGIYSNKYDPAFGYSSDKTPDFIGKLLQIPR